MKFGVGDGGVWFGLDVCVRVIVVYYLVGGIF